MTELFEKKKSVLQIVVDNKKANLFQTYFTENLK